MEKTRSWIDLSFLTYDVHISPFVDPLSPEDVGILVELGPQLAGQLVADVAARHAVAGGHADGEDHEGEGEHGVALQDLLLHRQKLLRLAEVTCGGM